VEQAEGLEVTAALSPEEAADAAARMGPEAVLIDAEAGESAAFALVERLRREAPGLHLAVLADSAPVVADAVAAGAAAVLPPDIGPDALGAALRAAVAGLAVMGRDMAVGLVPPAPDVDASLQPLERLTAREGEVLQLLARGLTNAEIGARLGLSEHTAKFHVGSVLGKLGARSRAEAVALGARLGWITV
jgi:DNA-binding NarL/FixJ family response regulator